MKLSGPDVSTTVSMIQYPGARQEPVFPRNSIQVTKIA
jgi:hypothetical protein